MPRPYAFSTPTTLYHPTEGSRVFQVGETDPGNAWSEHPGGLHVGAATLERAMEDLAAAAEAVDQLQAMLEKQNASLAESEGAKAAALAKLSDMEQRAIAAEKAKDAAEALQRQAMQERDSARAEVEALRAKARKPKTEDAG